MPIPFWRCAKCRREHDSYDGAEKCEQGHLIPIEVSVKSHSIRPYPIRWRSLFPMVEPKYTTQRTCVVESVSSAGKELMQYAGTNQRKIGSFVCESREAHRTSAGKALQAAMRRMKNPKAKTGKRSIKSLTQQGAILQNIEIADSNIKGFERSARKFGVDFALKKDIAADPPWYVVFFKVKDA